MRSRLPRLDADSSLLFVTPRSAIRHTITYNFDLAGKLATAQLDELAPLRMFCRYETFRSRVSATSCRPRSAAASRNIYTSGPDQVFMNHSYERCPSTHENAISPDIDSQLRFVFESLQGHPAKRCSRSNSLDACEVTSQPQKRCCRLFDFLKHCIARWRLGDEVIRSICWYRMSLQSRSRIGCPALAPDPFTGRQSKMVVFVFHVSSACGCMYCQDGPHRCMEARISREV